MFRRDLSDKEEKLDDFRNLRYSQRYRYLLNHEPLVHQDCSSARRRWRKLKATIRDRFSIGWRSNNFFCRRDWPGVFAC